MTPEDIGKQLAAASDRALSQSPGDDSIRLVQAAILNDLHPVRPLAPAWKFVLALIAAAAAGSTISAALLGPAGIHALSTAQAALILSAALAAGWLSAAACVREMRPASGTPLGAIALALAVAGFPILFASVFENYTTHDLVIEGIPCLRAGLAVALPTGILIAWILRRGFVLNWTAAGLAAGVLSGITGLGMLELHCANLKAIHVILWHVAVVLCSALIGLALGLLADRARSRSIL